jgi:hypothetical protein
MGGGFPPVSDVFTGAGLPNVGGLTGLAADVDPAWGAVAALSPEEDEGAAAPVGAADGSALAASAIAEVEGAGAPAGDVWPD